MSRFHISVIKMCGAVAATLLALFARSLHALPSTVFSNEVYPVSKFPTNTPPFSLAVTRNMSLVTDVREFFMKYVEDDRICSSNSIRNIIVGSGETNIAANIWWAKRCEGRRSTTYKKGSSSNLPEMSKAEQKKLNKLLKNKNIQCNPKKAVVKLPNDDAPYVMLKPSCVYVRQCGGCCDSHLLECRPTQIKRRKFKVLALEKKMNKVGALQFANGQTLRKVIVEEHKKCQCECIEREEHCTSQQRYDADACRCFCPPELSKTCPPGKVWDENKCDCVCSDVSECTTGRVFDNDTCRCLRT